MPRLSTLLSHKKISAKAFPLNKIRDTATFILSTMGLASARPGPNRMKPCTLAYCHLELSWLT